LNDTPIIKKYTFKLEILIIFYFLRLQFPQGENSFLIGENGFTSTKRVSLDCLITSS